MTGLLTDEMPATALDMARFDQHARERQSRRLRFYMVSVGAGACLLVLIDFAYGFWFGIDAALQIGALLLCAAMLGLFGPWWLLRRGRLQTAITLHVVMLALTALTITALFPRFCPSGTAYSGLALVIAATLLGRGLRVPALALIGMVIAAIRLMGEPLGADAPLSADYVRIANLVGVWSGWLLIGIFVLLQRAFLVDLLGRAYRAAEERDGAIERLKDLAARRQDELAREVAARTAELRAREQQMDAFVSNLPGFVMRLETAAPYRARYASAGSVVLTGYPPEHFYRGLQPLMDPGDVPAIEARFAVHRHGDFRIRRADGTTRWVHLRAGPLFLDDSGIELCDVIILDAQAERDAMQALRERDERFRVMTVATPNLLWSARPDGAVDFVAERAREVLGLAPEALLQQGWPTLMRPEWRDSARQTWLACVASGTLYAVSRELRVADGSYRWFRIEAQPARDAQGQVIAWMARPPTSTTCAPRAWWPSRPRAPRARSWPT